MFRYFYCGKKNSFYKQLKLCLTAFHFAACLHKQCNPKKEISALNLIDMTRPSIDTRLLLRNCGINCLKPGRSRQSVRPIFGADFETQT